MKNKRDAKVIHMFRKCRITNKDSLIFYRDFDAYIFCRHKKISCLFKKHNFKEYKTF